MSCIATILRRQLNPTKKVLPINIHEIYNLIALYLDFQFQYLQFHSQKIWIYFTVIQYNTGGCPAPFHSVCHKFYIQLALPISPAIMDRFWCSRCLNDSIKVPDMMRLFAGGATTPLVVKIWTKQPWVKIEFCATLIAISRYLEAKFDYGYFIIYFA